MYDIENVLRKKGKGRYVFISLYITPKGVMFSSIPLLSVPPCYVNFNLFNLDIANQ